MTRGRPVHSKIRENIIEILFYMNKGYGYQISKFYNEIFPEVTQRSIYYHLKKGVMTQEIKAHRVKKERGFFSWGSYVEKKYYTLGRAASPKGNEMVEAFLKRINKIK